MKLLKRAVDYLASRWWWVLVVTILNFISFNILFSLEDRFEGLTGLPVFDTQNELSPEQIVEQAPLYVGEAQNAYLFFAAYDFIFPFVAGLFVAVILMWLLRHNTSVLAQKLLQWNLPFFVFFGTVFDWLENLGILGIVFTNPDIPDFWIYFALAFKRLKLITLSFSSISLLLVTLFTIFNWLYRVWQSRTQTVSKVV
jgi:hypothetical protein